MLIISNIQMIIFFNKVMNIFQSVENRHIHLQNQSLVTQGAKKHTKTYYIPHLYYQNRYIPCTFTSVLCGLSICVRPLLMSCLSR